MTAHARRPPGRLVVSAVTVVILAAVYRAWGAGAGGSPAAPTRTTAALSVAQILKGDPDPGYARAYEPRAFEFPRDHGPHPGFRTEWWYLTGNLDGPRGEPVGFQLTIFRSALRPESAASTSDWTTNQVYMGHLALTDGRAGAFYSHERFSRGALGLAGAQAHPFRVWVEDWVMESGGAKGGEDAGADMPEDPMFPLKVRAAEGGSGLSLILTPDKPLVLQGEQGLSRKGPEPGNASYYYSYTRLRAEGTVTLDGVEARVQGQAWFDREWSTSALSDGQVGWDWFALQLSDGSDLMYYQLRMADGTASPSSGGAWIDPEGRSSRLTGGQVELRVLDRWKSPRGGTAYPARWTVIVPDREIELEVIPLVADQELDLTFRYWEGTVRVRGHVRGAPVTGRGYVELTGYVDPEAEST